MLFPKVQCLFLFDLLQNVVFANWLDDTARTKMTKTGNTVLKVPPKLKEHIMFVCPLKTESTYQSYLNIRELGTVIDFNTNFKNITILTKT